MDNKDPAHAAAINANEDTLLKYFKNIISVRATHIFAPDDIPSTKGPAIGLPKNVCNKKPESASAPPNTAEIIILGSLIFHIILYWVSSPVC